jgi:hypothetical protein
MSNDKKRPKKSRKPPVKFPITLRHGTVLTKKMADEAIEKFKNPDAHPEINTYVLGPGRPSLGPAGTSPQVTFRLTSEMRDKARSRAEDEGISVSTLARNAMTAYLAD